MSIMESATPNIEIQQFNDDDVQRIPMRQDKVQNNLKTRKLVMTHKANDILIFINI